MTHTSDAINYDNTHIIQKAFNLSVRMRLQWSIYNLCQNRPLKAPQKGARDLTRKIFFRGIVRNHRPLVIYFIEIKSSAGISSNRAKGQIRPISGDAMTPSAPNNLNFENRATRVFFNFYYLSFLKV